jgi:uncharacterized coiled-coil protein SlyX
MAIHVRSKSCSFVPQDLPASELFSDIKENRKLIRELNKQVVELAREISRQTHDFESLVVNHIKRIDAHIAGHESKILEITGFLHTLNRQMSHNSRDIRLLQGQIVELTRKVDALFHSLHARR